MKYFSTAINLMELWLYNITVMMILWKLFSIGRIYGQNFKIINF